MMKPNILFVDDKPDGLDAQVSEELEEHADYNVVHPNDLELSALEAADLVLVDYKLEDWPERNEQVVSLRPETGMALAVLLREQVDLAQSEKLTAFALHTGHLGEVRGRLPSASVEHILGRLNNLEWAFQKSESSRYHQMVVLASAVQQLPRNWPTESDDSMALVKNLLAIENCGESSEHCWRSVRACRAPVHDLTEDGHGILFLRWLLHEILPYPSFLWAEHWVAARLGFCVDNLREVMKGDSQLANDLRSMSYSGILAGFQGDRWWRGALEDYVWELAGQYGAEDPTLHDVLTERAGMELVPIDANPAVVCLNANLEPNGRFSSPMIAVTIRPDHWPAFADSAWMDVETVLGDPFLLSIVDRLDRHRVNINNK